MDANARFQLRGERSWQFSSNRCFCLRSLPVRGSTTTPNRWFAYGRRCECKFWADEPLCAAI